MYVCMYIGVSSLTLMDPLPHVAYPDRLSLFFIFLQTKQDETKTRTAATVCIWCKLILHGKCCMYCEVKDNNIDVLLVWWYINPLLWRHAASINHVNHCCVRISCAICVNFCLL